MNHKKKKIPKALREALWILHHPSDLKAKCPVPWCPNVISAYDFQAGHRIPESKGGPTTLENLVPICSRCNLSMSNMYTYDQWCSSFAPATVIPQKTPLFTRLFSCFQRGPRHEPTVVPAPGPRRARRSKLEVPNLDTPPVPRASS